MRHRISRRSFFKTVAVAGGGAGFLSTGSEPFRSSGQGRIRVSLAAYSFRDLFKNGDSSHRFDMLQFVDYCADHGCDGAELTSYYFPQPVTNEYLIEVRRRAFLRGVAVSGTAVGNNFVLPEGPKRDEQIASVKQWIDRAALLGAPHIRVFAGAAGPRPIEEGRRQVISALEECGEYAGKKGIFLGLENHGGLVSRTATLLDIIKTVKSPWVGINLDTGNFISDDPYQDIALCAPYAVNVQYKVEIHRGTGKTRKAERSDMSRVFSILRQSKYQGYAALEYEAAEDPMKAVPEELKRMLELARA